MTDAAALIEKRLADRGCLLLDGSMGQELQRRGYADDPAFWTAPALDDPDEPVRRLHAEYLAAGADVITTCTYALNSHRFETAGRAADFDRLNRAACAQAREAIRQCGRPALLAGSLPPLRTSYRPAEVGDNAAMRREYDRQAALLAEEVDLFLCETLTTSREAVAGVSAALAVAGGRPVWVSWSLSDDGSGRLRGGETIEAAAAALHGLDVGGYLLNCATPEALTAGLEALLALPAPVRGLYANGFRPIRDDAPPAGEFPARSDLDPRQYAAWATRWLSAGVELVGGCCEIGPAHIAELRRLLDARAGTAAG